MSSKSMLTIGIATVWLAVMGPGHFRAGRRAEQIHRESAGWARVL